MQYAFCDFILDIEAHALLRRGEAQHVEPLVFDMLHLLVRNAGTLVSRDQMVEELWHGRIVSESAISARIAAARKAVGDDGKRQDVIRTVARRGLQFVASVQTLNSAPTADKSVDDFVPRIRFATTDDGVKIAFAVSGKGPPLLYIPHHPTHLELEWKEPFNRQFFDALGAHHTLIRIDQRGCGISDLDVEDFSAARTAKDAITVLEKLGIAKASFFGSSSGGMIVAELAARHPDVVDKLVIQSGYVDGRLRRATGPEPKVEDSILQMAIEGWDTPGSPFVMAYLSAYVPTASKEQLRQIALNVQLSCPLENEIRGRSFFNRHSIADLLSQVKAPTLVIHSKDDSVHPVSEAQKMARGIPNAELVIVDSPNHYPRPDEPGWNITLSAIDAFLNS